MKLILDPNDILIPKRYNGDPCSCYDIALIGLSKIDKEAVD